MIETERLTLVPCGESHFEAFFQSEEMLADLLGVTTAKDWSSFPQALPRSFEIFKANPQNLHWGTHLFIHKKDKKLIGIGGFKGAADKHGAVEIGYEIAPEYRNQGLATEIARGLINRAFSFSKVRMVDAHTAAEENASGRILHKCGMKKIIEKYDAQDGGSWQWRVTRENYGK